MMILIVSFGQVMAASPPDNCVVTSRNWVR
jgi:hypothetical protein